MRLGWLVLLGYEVIDDPATAEPYMYRWRLIRTPWFGLYLHKVVRDDSDRDLHDHPFDFISLVLSGGYLEEFADGTTLHRRPWTVVRRQAERLHRVMLTESRRPAWTLVWLGSHRREWGFNTVRGWVPWRRYIVNRVRGIALHKSAGGQDG